MASEQKLGRVGDTPYAVVTTRAPGVLKIPRIDKVPRPSISNVIWILSSDTGTLLLVLIHYLSAQPIIFK